MQEVTVTNLPGAAIWIIAISQLLLAVGVIAVLALFGSQAVAILKEVKGIIEDMRRDAMPEVKATLKNVRHITDDAARTTHNVTTAADKVAGVVSTVASRVESPAVRMAGLLTGVVAGARAAKNAKSDDKNSKKGAKVAYSVKASELDGAVRADKIVIVTGPSFGTAVKLILFGAAIGAGAAFCWKNQQKSAPLSGPPADAEEVASRLQNLSTRAKSIAGRARDLVQNAAEVAGPALQQALIEGRAAARETEDELNAELKELRKDSPEPEQV